MDRKADNGLTSASGAAHSVQAQPAEMPTPPLQALKQRAHQLLESQLSLQLHNQALAAERLAFQSERDQQATQHQELSAERDALQAERDSLTAQLQEATAQRDSIQRERDGLAAERDGLISIRKRLDDQRDATREEFKQLKTAYLQIFPYIKYRSVRQDLIHMDDLEIANHYYRKGFSEGVLIWEAACCYG